MWKSTLRCLNGEMLGCCVACVVGWRKWFTFAGVNRFVFIQMWRCVYDVRGG